MAKRGEIAMLTFRTPYQPAQLTLTPYIDIYELPDKVIVLVDMPNVSKEEAEVKVENNDVLTIRGRCRQENATGRTRLIRECPRCDYYRALKLSRAIDVNHIEAEIKDGVLTITLPKNSSAQPIDVPIIVED
jgi:HSP20 family molecular chaperone IbpA